MNIKITPLVTWHEMIVLQVNIRVLINGRRPAKKPATWNIEQLTFPGNRGWCDRHSIAKPSTF